VVMGLAAAATAGRVRASVRHLLLTAMFAGLLALPLVAASAPPISVRVPVATGALADALDADRPAVPPRSTSQTEGIQRGWLGRASVAVSWTPILRVAWIAGAGLVLLPLVLVLGKLGRLRRTGLPWPERRDGVRALAADVGIEQPIEVLLHEEVPSPLTFGVRRPVILLPIDARAWAEPDLRRALVHELEHVRRGDWVVQVLAQAICAAYWFHPLVWVGWRRLTLEAERACDDAVVVREGGTEYAGQLVALAERLSSMQVQPTLGMAKRSDLSARVSAMLDSGQRRGRAGLAATAAAVSFAAVVVLAVAPIQAVATVVTSDAVAAGSDSTLGGSASALAPVSGQRRQRALDAELYEAAEAGDLAGVEEMLQAGANINAAIDGDGSPLIAAVRSGRTALVQYLLDRGADPNMGVDGDGSPLIAAAENGNVTLLALLLDRGADIEQVVDGDENALIQASGSGRLNAVRLLVERGANVNARVWVERTYRGAGEWRTPLSMARQGRHVQVVAFLQSAGAVE
jgi:bla regulator protein blaR1